MISHEALYQLLYDRQWAALLDAIHQHHDAVAAAAADVLAAARDADGRTTAYEQVRITVGRRSQGG